MNTKSSGSPFVSSSFPTPVDGAACTPKPVAQSSDSPVSLRLPQDAALTQGRQPVCNAIQTRDCQRAPVPQRTTAGLCSPGEVAPDSENMSSLSPESQDVSLPDDARQAGCACAVRDPRRTAQQGTRAAGVALHGHAVAGATAPSFLDELVSEHGPWVRTLYNIFKAKENEVSSQERRGAVAALLLLLAARGRGEADALLADLARACPGDARGLQMLRDALRNGTSGLPSRQSGGGG
ncbi:MAG: hypothetical protein OXC07_04505 [Kistimonas sp.]|nr:hypothetical protein [Kistimonas sp.]